MQRFSKFLTFFSVLLFFSGAAFSQNFPEKSNALVTDYTGTLSQQEVSQLEHKLVAFDDSTSTQIAVVLIKSLDGYDVNDYAVRLAEKWGIGQQKKNNGLIILVSIGDRKISIQTGYGLEGAVPDAIAKRIIENEIKPEFKNGDYYAGLDKGTDAIISYTKGEYKNDNPRKSKKDGIPAGLIILIVIIILIIIFRGGRGNGGNQVIGRGGSASPFWWFLMGNAMGGGNRGSGWGGGSSGGGFGGFGGGSFGGGGASGSW